MAILFRGGTLVMADGLHPMDLRVENEKIAALGVNLPEAGAEVVDCTGKLLLPGAIDAHTHLECVCSGIDTSDDYFTGTRAAACGGTTTVIDYLLQAKGEALPDTLKPRVKLASGKAAVDFAFHIGVSDLSTPELLASTQDAIRDGVSSFKAYMVYDFGLSDAELFELLRYTAPLGGLVTVHAENRAAIDRRVKAFLDEGHTSPWYHYLSRDESVATEAAIRAIGIARAAEAPLYIVHLSDAGAAAYLRQVRGEGYPIFAETCPQYLRFTSEVYRGERGQDYVCAPPIKGQASQDALWTALQRGDIDTVATDHCPFTRAEKDYGLRQSNGQPGTFATIPNGCDGIETMYPYLLSEANQGRLTFPQAAALCAGNPAKLFGLADRKGALLPGLDADVVVYDPSLAKTVRCVELHGHLDHTIWEGTELRGCPVATYSRGRLLCRDGKYLGKAGDGRFQRCNPVRFTSPTMG